MKEVFVGITRHAQFRKQCQRRVRIGSAFGKRQRPLGIKHGVRDTHVRKTYRSANEAVGVDGMKISQHLEQFQFDISQ